MSQPVPSPKENTPYSPRHVAVIMDGNGRWATQRGLPRIKGHEAGSKAVAQCVEACHEAGVGYLTLYAFSSENWKRPVKEVDSLMLLLGQFLEKKTSEMKREGIRIQAIGHIERLPPHCQKRLQQAMEKTAHNSKLVLTLALSYGSRWEITDAVRALLSKAEAGELSASDITPEAITSHLYTKNLPDPDLFIRTSGEHRISNFLLWQLSYTELVFLDKLWPDFTKADLHAAIAEFQKRDRRFGGV